MFLPDIDNGVNSYIAQLKHDLKPSPQNLDQNDIYTIINKPHKELKKLWPSELKNKDKVNQIFRTIIINYVENQAYIIASLYPYSHKAINVTSKINGK